jgi:hypothetical protein
VIERFPADFMSQLTDDAAQLLRYQIGTQDVGEKRRGRGDAVAPEGGSGRSFARKPLSLSAREMIWQP